MRRFADRRRTTARDAALLRVKRRSCRFVLRTRPGRETPDPKGESTPSVPRRFHRVPEKTTGRTPMLAAIAELTRRRRTLRKQRVEFVAGNAVRREVERS